jgi:hypothetical protein
VQTEEFEQLLKAFADISDGSSDIAGGYSMRAQADAFLIRHLQTSADKLRQFLTYPVHDTLAEHSYVGPARIAVHCYRKIAHSDQDVLSLAANPKIPWYVRQECLLALALPMSKINWDGVKVIVADKTLDNGIRIAALDLIVAHQKRDLVAFLKDVDEAIDQDDYFGQELSRKISSARLRLADMTAIVLVLRSLLSPWSHKSLDAKNALEDVQTACGGAPFIAKHLIKLIGQEPSGTQADMWLQLQGHPEPAARIWALKHAPSVPKQHQKCLDLLTSSDWLIQKAASNWLTENKSDLEPLLAMADDANLNIDARSWAAMTYIHLGGNARRFAELRTPQSNPFAVVWAFNAPASVRIAILKEYVPQMENGSDIRYHIEQANDVSPAYTSEVADREKLLSALQQDGLEVISCQCAGEANQQGGGTYWKIKVAISDEFFIVLLSTLGPFAQVDYELDDEMHTAFVERLNDILSATGIRLIDDELLSQTVPGLNVYFFGDRAPLTIAELLFYWQD